MAFFQRSLVWLRRDLRLVDHTALAQACARSQSVAVVFVFDDTILLKLSNKHDRRVSFIWESLQVLAQKLHEMGSFLVVRQGDPLVEIPRLASELQVQGVFANRDYEPLAVQRDQAVGAALATQKCGFFLFKDQVVFEKDEVKSKSGGYFQVFTPYSRAWIDALEKNLEAIALQKTDPQKFAKRSDWGVSGGGPSSLRDVGFFSVSTAVKPGMHAANESLKSFCTKGIFAYDSQRDLVDGRGTSGLSVHLRFGTVSVRTAVRGALTAAKQGEGGAGVVGPQTWLRELIWREFYQMILSVHPRLAQGESFKTEYNSLVWPGSVEHLERWKEGTTGYPLVDAAMRHFAQTGCMHNRLRMVVASFLTKDLLVDWRKGESYFADNLLDFDFAANNGGWQWCASTGCDAQPYFRIFNPIEQSKKWDPHGTFIRALVPELSHFSDAKIHWPHDLDAAPRGVAEPLWSPESVGSSCNKGYPSPVVHHSFQREKALALLDLKRLKK